MMKYLILFSLLIFIACTEVKKQEEIVSKVDGISNRNMFFPKFYWKDTLYLNVMIDDCGEWGGPEDRFKIYKDSAWQYYIDFKRYNFICDNDSGIHEREELINYQKILILNDSTKNVISNFLLNLMEAKVQERVNSNAGSGYHLFNNDSTLSLDVHSTEKKIEKDYYNFKRGLGFPENRKKEEGIPIEFDAE